MLAYLNGPRAALQGSPRVARARWGACIDSNDRLDSSPGAPVPRQQRQANQHNGRQNQNPACDLSVLHSPPANQEKLRTWENPGTLSRSFGVLCCLSAGGWLRPAAGPGQADVSGHASRSGCPAGHVLARFPLARPALIVREQHRHLNCHRTQRFLRTCPNGPDETLRQAAPESACCPVFRWYSLRISAVSSSVVKGGPSGLNGSPSR
jgi:hypothetical protein